MQISAPSCPLVVTADPEFAESARRWCAAAGRETETIDDVGAIRSAWRSAPVVVVDARQLEPLLAVELPRRDDVVVVAPEPEVAWRASLDLGARDVLRWGEDSAIVSVVVRALDGVGEACAISVIGACGGVGASTLAVATAAAAVRRDLNAVLVDGDSSAGGVDLLLGAEAAEGSRWHDLDGAIGQVGAGELAATLPTHHGVSLVTFGRDAEPVYGAAPVISAAVRGFDVVVADVPRHLGDLGRELVARSVLTVLVVPRRLGGVVAAHALADRLDARTESLAVVTRSCPSALSPAAVEKQLGLPVLADVGRSRRLPTDLEHGLGPLRTRTVTAAARRILDTVGLR